IRPLTLLRNICMYIAGMLVALGIRQGDFEDYDNIRDLLDGHDDELRWKNPELPLFRAAGARGLTVKKSEPMSSNGARAFFHRCAAKVGIDGTGENTMPAAPYSCRANFATKLKQAKGLETTAMAMAHCAGSHTVSENYDHGNARLDFFGIATDEDLQDNVQSGRNVAVFCAPVDVAPLDMAGLVDREPILAILVKQAQNLQDCLALGGGAGEDWKGLVVRRLLLPFPPVR
ncbi:hypothetical protein FB451DRAFT_1020714, partial [Mycena latifolia]